MISPVMDYNPQNASSLMLENEGTTEEHQHNTEEHQHTTEEHQHTKSEFGRSPTVLILLRRSRAPQNSFWDRNLLSSPTE